MGKVRRADRVNLIAGLLSGDLDALASARLLLIRAFGKTDFESALIDFDHTDYYEDEMGSGLKRQFLSFEKLLPMNNIWSYKLRTNALEGRLTRDGKRTVNIDPGYLDLSKLVLFSTKDYSHRIYLGGGIFAEVTLFYKDGRFQPWPWTYPDYKTECYADIFRQIRELYKAKVAS